MRRYLKAENGPLEVDELTVLEALKASQEPLTSTEIVLQVFASKRQELRQVLAANEYVSQPLALLGTGFWPVGLFGWQSLDTILRSLVRRGLIQATVKARGWFRVKSYCYKEQINNATS